MTGKNGMYIIIYIYIIMAYVQQCTSSGWYDYDDGDEIIMFGNVKRYN